MKWSNRATIIFWIVYVIVVIGLVLLASTRLVYSVQEYRTTYYNEEFQGSLLACGSDIYGLYDVNDPTTAAASWDQHQCGDRLTVCGIECQTVIVKDKCGECGPNHIDLSKAAWIKIGQVDYAIVTDINEPITLPKTGTGI